MIANVEQQLGPGTVLQVHDLAANQLERGILQFGQVEGEWELALEPWFYRVPIGRNHVDRIRTRHGGHMQVDQLRQSVLGSSLQGAG